MGACWDGVLGGRLLAYLMVLSRGRNEVTTAAWVGSLFVLVHHVLGSVDIVLVGYYLGSSLLGN